MEFVILFFWLVAAIICAYLADNKGYNTVVAALVGILIGFIGVLIYALLPNKKTAR